LSEPGLEGNLFNVIAWFTWLKDKVGRAQRAIGYPHSEIHGGDHYESGTWGNLNGSLIIVFEAGASKYPHWIYNVMCEGAMQAQLYENPTLSDKGDALSAFNNNRNSTNTPVGTVYANPTVTNIGTRVPAGAILGGTNVGNTMSSGGAQRDAEKISSLNKQFALMLLTESALDFETEISWYEETEAGG